jgi:acetylglutamate kinase
MSGEEKLSTLVIKIGGGEGIDASSLMVEVAELVSNGSRVVVVHGGSHETNELSRSLGHAPRTIVSPSGHESRRTDSRTLDIFKMVYCGKINKAVVEQLRALGVDAIGLSGIDAGIWQGRRKNAIRAVEGDATIIVRDDLSGRVEQVNGGFLNELLDKGMVPVLTPPAVTPDGVAINVDADRAAAATAAAIGAQDLLLLSNVPGLLRNQHFPDSLIKEVCASDMSTAHDAAKGRMKNKVLAAEEAIKGGVQRVVIGSALGQMPIGNALSGRGTTFHTGSAPVPGAELVTADVRVLVDLVAVPSVSGQEHLAARVFANHADQLGFECESDRVGNVIANTGASETCRIAHIMMLGHIDTVPGDIPVRVADGELHGRGSVDAKGPLAAMLLAASRAELPEGIRVSVAAAVGEESADSIGAHVIAENYSPDACIIGEPSGWDGVTLGYKGRLVVSAEFVCDSSHSAGEELSACDKATQWWAEVCSYTEAFNEGKPKVFDQIQTRLLSFQSSSDGMTQSATIEAGFRLPVGVQPREIRDQLKGLLPPIATMECKSEEIAHQSDRNDPVVRAITGGIRSNGGKPKPKLKTGTADLNVVGPIWKCPIAAYGPGDSCLDHTPNERLSLDEFNSAIRVLTHSLETLAKELVQTKAATGSGEASRTMGVRI